ncbi:recombinase family protein [Streptomyces sp. NPDC004296]|uniref:recombinase family protein n=1 Tax=Streptomyces sp. NPDC004296 TaxID=3364697 RepID=UPI0036918957
MGRRLGGLRGDGSDDAPPAGPWLRGEKGSHDGLVAAAVDRLGRNVVDCLNTGYKMRDEGKILITYGHDGPWDLNGPADENRFTIEARGAQMELRAIQRRNRDATRKSGLRGGRKGNRHTVSDSSASCQEGLSTRLNCTRMLRRRYVSWSGGYSRIPRTSHPAVSRRV